MKAMGKEPAATMERTRLPCKRILPLMVRSGFDAGVRYWIGLISVFLFLLLIEPLRAEDRTPAQPQCQLLSPKTKVSIPLPVSDVPLWFDFTDYQADTRAVLRNEEGQRLAVSNTWAWMEGRYGLFVEAHWLKSGNDLSIERYDQARHEAHLCWSASAVRISESDSSAATHFTLYRLYNEALSRRQRDGEQQRYSQSTITAFEQAIDQAQQVKNFRLQALLTYELGLFLQEKSHRDPSWLDQSVQLLNTAADALQVLEWSAMEASALNTLGLIHSDTGHWEEAITLFERALSLRDKLGQKSHAAITHSNLGLLYQRHTRLLDAQSHFLIAARYFLCEQEINYRDIEFYLQAGNVCGELNSLFKTLNNLGLVLEGLGELQRAEELWLLYLDVPEAQQSRSLRASVHNNLGTLYFKLGQYGDALSYLHRANEYFSQHGEAYWKALTQGNLGKVNAALGRVERAEFYFREALETEQISTVFRAQHWHDLGVLLLTRDTAQALQLLGRAEQAYRAAKHVKELVKTLERKAEAMVLLKRYAEAKNYLREALVLSQQTAAVRLTGRVLAGLGEIYLAEQRYSEAAAVLMAAQHGKLENNDELFRLETTLGLAQALAASDTPQALALVEEALQLTETIRINMVAPNLRAEFLATQRRVFELSVDLQMQQRHTLAAWETTEHSRSRTLLDLTRQRRSLVHDGSSAALQNEQRALLKEMNALSGLLAEYNEAFDADAHGHTSSARHGLAVQWQQRVHAINDELDLIDAQLLIANEQKQTNVASIDDIQRAIDGDTVVLSYFLGQERSYLWRISRDDVVSYDLPSHSLIQMQARSFLAAVEHSSSALGLVRREARALRQLLWPSSLSIAPEQRIILLPDGVLHRLPTEWMLADFGLNQSVSQRISQLGSASMLIELRQRKASSAQGTAILANPSIHPEHHLSTLNGSRLEAQAIVDILKPHARLWQGDELVRSRLLTGELSPFRVVHIASHGVVNERVPALSALLLSANPESARQEYLYPNDIVNLELNADLVILSSCDSASGQSLVGEGVLSITRPFFIAGARQVVASLWQVSDRATAVFMEQFYRHYHQHQDTAAALQAAKSWMTQQRDYAHPYYWAGFVLQGDGQGRPSVATTTVRAEALKP